MELCCGIPDATCRGCWRLRAAPAVGSAGVTNNNATDFNTTEPIIEHK